MIDPNVPNSDHAPSRSTVLDIALQIGLVGFLIYACGRYISPFSDLLIWSAILAVMLYPLHLRLTVRIGNRWSALLIGLVGVAVMLVAMATVVASLATSLYSLIVGLHDQSLTVPPPPRWLAELPLVGQKLTEIWVLVATNMPAAVAKYGGALSEAAARLVSSAGGLAAGQLSFVLSFGIAAVIVAYGRGAADFARRLLGRFTGSGAGGPSGYADGRYDPWRGGRRCLRSGDPVASPRSGLLRHWSSSSRPLDGCCASAMYRTSAGGTGDTADHSLCLCDGSNAAGDHFPGLDPRRRAQRQYPEAIDARPRNGSADAGNFDRRHRRHDCRRPSRAVCGACGPGRRLCAAHRMDATAPGPERAADRRSDAVKCDFCCRHASGSRKLASMQGLPSGCCLDEH